MPKIPRDFSKGLIYSIVCKTDETLLYVGSTTNFTQRKNRHKTACYCEKNKDHNTPVYVMIRANGGWDNFVMKPVKEFPCENNIQLVIEEERVRKEMKANLNTNKAYRTPEEYKEYYKEHHKQYIKDNAERMKQYNKDNTEHFAEQKKQYYEKNKEHLLERQKQYKEANKAKLDEDGKKYREANKQRILERRKIKKQELKNAL